MLLDRRIAPINRAKADCWLRAIVEADAGLADTGPWLCTVRGVGAIVAATLIAELPEHNRLDWLDRLSIRTMLNIASLHASRRDATFKAFRLRLEAAGKPFKAPITDIARTLFTVLNAMLTAGNDKRPVISNPR